MAYIKHSKSEEKLIPTVTTGKKKLKQNPNDKKECDSGSAVSSSASNNTLINDFDRVPNSSTLSNNNRPTDDLMNPRNNSLFPDQPEIRQIYDNAAADNDVDEFGNFISATQPPVITEQLQVSSSEKSSTSVNHVDTVLCSSNINVPTTHSENAMNGNNSMVPVQMYTNNTFTNNSEFLSPPDIPMSQNSDNITDNDDSGDFVSVPQTSLSNYQTSTSSATEPFTIPYSENSSVPVNTIGAVPNLSASISNNASGCQSSLMQSNFESHVVPGQMNTNNTSALQQLINNFVSFGQSLISLYQLTRYNLFQMSSLENGDSNLHVPISESGEEFSIAYPETALTQYNLFQMSSLENRDFNVHVPIPESEEELSIAYQETVEDFDNIEMIQLFHILFI